ncbi:unnamed protein product, partial [Pelagomonas calceolata]
STTIFKLALHARPSDPSEVAERGRFVLGEAKERRDVNFGANERGDRRDEHHGEERRLGPAEEDPDAKHGRDEDRDDARPEEREDPSSQRVEAVDGADHGPVGAARRQRRAVHAQHRRRRDAEDVAGQRHHVRGPEQKQQRAVRVRRRRELDERRDRKARHDRRLRADRRQVQVVQPELLPLELDRAASDAALEEELVRREHRCALLPSSAVHAHPFKNHIRSSDAIRSYGAVQACCKRSLVLLLRALAMRSRRSRRPCVR